MANPFTPGFGTSPRILIGREEILEHLARAFLPTFDPHRTSWLRAPRGSGKTVLLNEIQDHAGLAGWITVQEDAQGEGLCGRIIDQLRRHLPPPPTGRRVRAVHGQVLGTGGGFELQDPAGGTSPARVRDVLEQVLATGVTGVLITVDEVHTARRDELAELGNAIQHLLRQDRPVAVLLAGLPQPDHDQLATFLTRCTTPDLQRLGDDAVRLGLQRCAKLEHGRFTSEAVELATSAIAGYPYMLQLVGYWAWEQAARDVGDGPVTITKYHVTAALGRAEQDLTRAVLQPLARPLSRMDGAFLRAMARDAGPTRIGDLRDRLGKTGQYINEYKLRLLDQGLIIEHSHGHVDFAIPGLRAVFRAQDRLQVPDPTEPQAPRRLR